jgi:DNA-binding response OmpR family regulator
MSLWQAEAMALGTSKGTVLVADGHEARLAALVSALHNAGYQVLTATDGRRALAGIAAGRPDAVLLDLDLPILDGREVCACVERMGLTVPMLLMADEELDRDASLPCRAAMVAATPSDCARLVRAIDRLTDRATPAICC